MLRRPKHSKIEVVLPEEKGGGGCSWFRHYGER
jgi:hypothetical protein